LFKYGAAADAAAASENETKVIVKTQIKIPPTLNRQNI